MKTITISTLEDLPRAAREFVEAMDDSTVFAFYGDMGAGKTTFINALCRELGVSEDVATSPSFSIVNEYRSDTTAELIYHFDLYRLENEGLETIKEELREYSKPGVLTFVEWADFGAGELPYNRLNISVSYDEEEFNDTRYYEFSPVGIEYEEFTKKILNSAVAEGLI